MLELPTALAAPIIGAVTAVVRAISSLIMLILHGRRERRSREPTIELDIAQFNEQGWVRIDLTIRNTQPYSVYVEALRITWPPGAALYREADAWKRGGDVNARAVFVADPAPRASASIDKLLPPAGTPPRATYVGRIAVPGSTGAITRRTFYAWLPPSRWRPGSPKRRCRMSLLWESRLTTVSKFVIPVKRTITLSAPSNPTPQ